MALTFDATPKGASSNSYILEADADSYFDGRMEADAWTNALSPDKEKALVAATDRLELLRFVGRRTAGSQRLKWPREFVPDEDTTDYWDADAVPRFVQFAACEYAMLLLQQKGSSDIFADTGLEGFTEVVGKIKINPKFTAGQLPKIVKRYLRPFVHGALGPKLTRG